MNGVLLSHLLFVLSKIAAASEENMMPASNLAICIGPSILWATDSTPQQEQQHSKDVSNVAKILIDHYQDIYGQDPPATFDQDSNKTPKDNSIGRKSGRSKYDIKIIVLGTIVIFSIFFQNSMTTRLWIVC